MFNYVELQLCFGNGALQILLSGCFTVDENTGERSKTIKDTKIRGKASSVITMGVNVIAACCKAFISSSRGTSSRSYLGHENRVRLWDLKQNWMLSLVPSSLTRCSVWNEGENKEITQQALSNIYFFYLSPREIIFFPICCRKEEIKVSNHLKGLFLLYKTFLLSGK